MGCVDRSAAGSADAEQFLDGAEVDLLGSPAELKVDNGCGVIAAEDRDQRAIFQASVGDDLSLGELFVIGRHVVPDDVDLGAIDANRGEQPGELIFDPRCVEAQDELSIPALQFRGHLTLDCC